MQHGIKRDFCTVALTLYRSEASCSASSALTCWVSSRVACRKGDNCKKTPNQVLVSFQLTDICVSLALTDFWVGVLLPSADTSPGMGTVGPPGFAAPFVWGLSPALCAVCWALTRWQRCAPGAGRGPVAAVKC